VLAAPRSSRCFGILALAGWPFVARGVRAIVQSGGTVIVRGAISLGASDVRVCASFCPRR
jgi:hypothetical protein